jgi:3-hydroxyisobutyrate dehydrogenase-like beta-hydroxyacid dehydrogenase
MAMSPDGRTNRESVVGFIGAGQIGEPMVERLLAGGDRVRVYARRSDVRERLAALGAELVDRPADVAQDAQAVVNCLFSDAQVLELLPPVIAAMETDAVLLSHTTGTPATLEYLAGLGPIRVVDAPFSGVPDHIREGRLSVFLGGEPEARVIAHDVVLAYADPVIHAGPLGSALRIKLLNNLLFAIHSQVALLALTAAEQLGVAEGALLEAISISSGGSTAAQYITGAGGADSYARALLPFLRKDLAACQDIAAGSGADLSGLMAALAAGPMDLTEPVSPG